jgi:hypothetical protein
VIRLGIFVEKRVSHKQGRRAHGMRLVIRGERREEEKGLDNKS